jgi:hypothetical protein
MLGDDEIKEMQEQIEAMEKEVRVRKKALHEAKYAGLRAAMLTRKDADAASREELKSLGYPTATTFPTLDWFRF